jgi:hypothetical protein
MVLQGRISQAQHIQNPGKPNEFNSNVTKADNFGDGVTWITGTSLVA